MGFEDLIGDPFFFSVGNGLVAGVELELNLLQHVARTCPAHQRVDPPRLLGFELQEPELRPGLARLHGCPGWLINSRAHVPIVLLRPVVGAA